jgi:hypothetical protein
VRGTPAREAKQQHAGEGISGTDGVHYIDASRRCDGVFLARGADQHRAGRTPRHDQQFQRVFPQQVPHRAPGIR